MSTKFILVFAAVALCSVATRAQFSGTLATPTDSEAAALLGGACFNKVEITCNGAHPDCVALDCFRMTGTGSRKASPNAPVCGVADCGYVVNPTPCAIVPPPVEPKDDQADG